MCELFGFYAEKNYDLTNWLKEFYSHSPQHPDGWGLATFCGNSVSVEKEPVCANDSEYLARRLAEPVEEKLLLAHIRKASVGSLQYFNCHPFIRQDASGRVWTLIHNGTVFQSEILEAYTSLQRGSTDSERILLHIVEQIDRLEKRLGRRADARERFDAVEASVAAVAPGNKVNLILYDGELFYIHNNMESRLWQFRLPDAVLVSTKPLFDGQWSEVPTSALMAFRDGKELFRGEDRHHAYMEPTPEGDVQPGFTALLDGFGI